MIVFLKRIRVKTIFSKFEPVKVEALELEYLKTVLDSLDVENYIIDDLFSLKEAKNLSPDILVLTGYNVSENEIIKEAKRYKKYDSNIKILVGGVHVQLNASDFHSEYIDYVLHSQSLQVFKDLIEKLKNNNKEILSKGIDSNIHTGKDKEVYWNIGSRESIRSQEGIIADRRIFDKIVDQTRYLEKKRVALIKGSVGCEYTCAYCYCNRINGGHFIAANYSKMRREIQAIDGDYFWIVDDILFSSRDQALVFIGEFKKINPRKKMIVYLRADFILKNLDLLSKLKEVGIVEVIVGFEATRNEELKAYEKTTDALDYPRVIQALANEEIHLTALFMVNPNYGFKDFKNLNQFIKENKVEVFTLSILTPIKGTKTYRLLEKDLTTRDPRKFDFLHLVLPSKLPRGIFYILFYGIQVRLLKSRRIWKFILRK